MTADFHVLKEYDYASSGMNELLSRGAGIFKAHNIIKIAFLKGTRRLKDCFENILINVNQYY